MTCQASVLQEEASRRRRNNTGNSGMQKTKPSTSTFGFPTKHKFFLHTKPIAATKSEMGAMPERKQLLSPRMTDWERTFLSVISMNNVAVSLLRLGQFKKVQSTFALALLELKHVSKGVSIHSPHQTTCPDQSSDTVRLDDWMTVPSQEEQSDLQKLGSFFLYREGIIIPSALANDSRYSKEALCKAISFVVFFNHGLSCHLWCCSEKHQLSRKEKESMVGNADQLYRLALQYRKEERSSKGRFLLAVCNNIAVLDRQFIASGHCQFTMDAYNLSTVNTVGAGFEYLRWLLRRHPPTSSSTTEEIELWKSYMKNLEVVMKTVADRSNCAGAA
eukprot:scaffold3844_cov105-Cylindrotheca_fusiformis.AAC.7